MLPSPSNLMKKYNIGAKKSLGQNFILDKNFTDKIVRSVPDIKGGVALEVGPGIGTLTASILDAGVKKLVAIEKDEICLDVLSELKNHYKDQFEIINADAILADEEKIFAGEKFHIIANLPYNIGTVLLIKWLKISSKISSMTLMLQKEVVERIIASKPGDKHYGRLGVMVNFFCETKMLFEVNPGVFTPQPKVTSAIVQIIPRKNVENIEFAKLEKVVAAAFNQRRKMIRSTLSSVLSNVEKSLQDLSIDPKLRAENLSIEDFYKITKSIS